MADSVLCGCIIVMHRNRPLLGFDRMPSLQFHDNVDVSTATDILTDSGEFVFSDHDGMMIRVDESVSLADGTVAHQDNEIDRCEECHESHLEGECCDAVSTEDGHWFCSDDCATDAGYHCHDDGEWHDEPQDCPSGNNLHSWNETNDFDRSQELQINESIYPYKIGFEVEKEDRRHRETPINSLLRNRYWKAMHDGSLMAGEGFELVSPIYNLGAPIGGYENAMNQPLQTAEVGIVNDTDLPVFDASTSHRCGGHITVSRRNLTGAEFLQTAVCQRMAIMMLTLYRYRSDNGYCFARRIGYINEGVKFNAVNIKPNAIEFRIPRGVETRKQLLWRFRLIRELAMPQFPTLLQDVSSGQLGNVLREVYDADRMEHIKRLIPVVAGWFLEDEGLPNLRRQIRATVGMKARSASLIA